MINIKKKIDNLKIEKRAFINGKFVKATNGKTIKKTSPADGRDLSGIASCDEKDVDKAIKSAKKAFSSRIWVDKNPAEKKKIMLKLADLMEEHREELALLDTAETGRSYKNYYYDSIPKAIEVVRYFAEGIDKIYDQSIPLRANASATIIREPIGVVGCITPWNDPLVPASWKYAPALLMGNSVVIKPAEQSSFSILKIAQLAKKAGIPDGVFNVVTGYGEKAGKALALHKDVSGVFFTGSSEVGKLIMQYIGQSNIKKVGLECGGKSAFIVSEKCKDLKKAAAVLAKNIFYNQGQICSAPSRAIIHNKVKNKFMGYLKKEAVKYEPRDPFSDKNEVGCVISKEQKIKIEQYIQLGLNENTKIYRLKNRNTRKNSTSVAPIIFDDVNPKSILAKEEIFGPVLCVFGAKSLTEAIKLANNSRYGLAASIWTDDVNEAYQTSRLLEVGIVHINSYGEDDNTVPFGGIKESGIGKDKSIYAFNEYSNIKTIWAAFDSISSSKNKKK